jgi:hypothetical protein
MRQLTEGEYGYWKRLLEGIYNLVDMRRNRFNMSFLDSVQAQLLTRRMLSDKQKVAVLNIAEGLNLDVSYFERI